MAKQHNNITLIGMPASGKSTIGVLLAKRLGYSFVDVDIVIQEQEKRLLKEIIEDEGLDGFLEVENRANATLDGEIRDRPRRQCYLWKRGHGAFKRDRSCGILKTKL